MKNQKLTLKELKVKSFVTNMKNGNAFTLKGGSGLLTCNEQCDKPELTKTGCSFLYCD